MPAVPMPKPVVVEGSPLNVLVLVTEEHGIEVRAHYPDGHIDSVTDFDTLTEGEDFARQQTPCGVMISVCDADGRLLRDYPAPAKGGSDGS